MRYAVHAQIPRVWVSIGCGMAGVEMGIPGVKSCKSFRIIVGREGGEVGMRRSGHQPIGTSGNLVLWAAILSALLTFGIHVAWAQTLPPQTRISSAGGPAPKGIPRDLARFRAQQLKDIRYQLSYTITLKADFISGHEELRFVQNPDDRGILPEWLDFREGQISSLTVNDQPASTEIQNGHVELRAKLLKLGENVVHIDFTANVAPAGKAITRFEDKDDGSEYIYTLFVPMDADMAFPCFDQPDLKARFQLSLDLPQGWTAISNTKNRASFVAHSLEGGEVHAEPTTWFAETKPISTYLFAFAAGPFKKVNDKPGLPGLYVRKSKFEKAQAEAEAVQQITADGIKYLSDYFAQPFPFPKYDMVMIPGFAYGGMEHAGDHYH